MKKLYLSKNKISDIKVLEKVKSEKLEILDLDENNIYNIDIFKKVNFKELKQLYLYNNNITGIKVLELVNLKKWAIAEFNSEIYDILSDLYNLLPSKLKILIFEI